MIINDGFLHVSRENSRNFDPTIFHSKLLTSPKDIWLLHNLWILWDIYLCLSLATSLFLFGSQGSILRWFISPCKIMGNNPFKSHQTTIFPCFSYGFPYVFPMFSLMYPRRRPSSAPRLAFGHGLLLRRPEPQIRRRAAGQLGEGADEFGRSTVSYFIGGYIYIYMYI